MITSLLSPVTDKALYTLNKVLTSMSVLRIYVTDTTNRQWTGETRSDQLRASTADRSHVESIFEKVPENLTRR
jgi:hypothetical protein